MRLSPWSLLLLLLLILCSLWPPGPCLPTWSHFDTQATKRKGSTRLKTDRGTQGGRHGDTLCPSQCRLQKKGTLGCFRAEHVDLHQLARCLLSLPAVEVVELVSPHFPCNCTLIHFVVLTSSAHIVTLTLPSSCSAQILWHCGPMLRRLRPRKEKKKTPRFPGGAGLRDRHVILSKDAPPLPQMLWHGKPAAALAAIVVRMDHQRLDWATARKKGPRPRESASDGHSLQGYTLKEPAYITLHLHKRQPAAVTPNAFVKNRDTWNIGKRRTLVTTRTENYLTNTHRRRTVKRNHDVKEIFDKLFDLEEVFNNSEYIPTGTFSNDTVLNNVTKLDAEKLFEGTSNHKGFRYFNSQESKPVLSANKTANLIIASIQPHQILYKTKIKSGGYVESKSKAAKESAEYNSWGNSLYMENSENKKPTITHTSGDHNRTRRNVHMRKRRIPNKALNKGKQIKGREVTINRKNFKKQRNDLEVTEFLGIGIFGTGKGKRKVAKKPTEPLNMNVETNRHVGEYKQFEKPAHERQNSTEVVDPVTDDEDKNAHTDIQTIHKTPQFPMSTDENNAGKHEDEGQQGRSKRTAIQKKFTKNRIKRKQKRDDDEDAGNENDSETVSKDTEYKNRYAREADDEEEEEGEEEDSDDDDSDKESDSDDNTKDKMSDDKDEEEEEKGEDGDADGDDDDDDDADDNKDDSENPSTDDPKANKNGHRHVVEEIITEVQETETIVDPTENTHETDDQGKKKKGTKKKPDASKKKPNASKKKPKTSNRKLHASKIKLDASKPANKQSLVFYVPKSSNKIEEDINNKTDINTKVYSNSHDIMDFLFNLPTKIKEKDPLLPLRRLPTPPPIDDGNETEENWEKKLGPYADDEVLFMLESLHQVHQFASSPNEDNDLPYIADKAGSFQGMRDKRPPSILDPDSQIESTMQKYVSKRSAPTRKRDKKGAKKDKKADKKDAKKDAKKDKGKKKDKEKTDVTVEQTKKGAVINVKEKSSSKKNGKKGSKLKVVEEEEDEDDEDFEGEGHQDGFSKAVTAMTDVASSLGGILMILTIVCFCFCCRKKQPPGKREDVGFVGKLLQIAGIVKPTDDKEKLLAKDTSQSKTEEKAKPVVTEEKPTLLSAIEPAAPTPPQPAEETYKQTSEHQDFLKRLTKQRLSIYQMPVEEDEAEAEQPEPAAQPSPQAAQPMPSSPAAPSPAAAAPSSSATTTSESDTAASKKKKADDKKKTDKKKGDKKKSEKSDKKKGDKKKSDKKKSEKSDKKKTDKKKSDKKDSGKEEKDKKKTKEKSKKK